MSNVLIPNEKLMDLAIENGLVPDNYFTLWDEIAKWQMDVLIQEGLKREDYVLDIGCGGMRIGIYLVDFLLDNHYAGIDAYQGYINFAQILMKKYMPNKNCNLLYNQEFDFGRFDLKFNFAIAQSVFTHLSNEQIDDCIVKLKKVMLPGSKFIFTYLLNNHWTRGFLYDGYQTMERSLIEDENFFLKLASEHSLSFRKIDVQHPTKQLTGVFKF